LREQLEGFMKLSVETRDDAHALQCELAGEVLRSSGSLHLRVAGWSMLPTVWPGDTLIIEPANGRQVCEGDVVLFSRGRQFVAHRVVAISHAECASFHTQGDALPCPDSPLVASQLLGKVSFVQRAGKCAELRRHRPFVNRAVAAVLRRSTFTARAVVGVRGMLLKLRGPSPVPASPIQASHVQTATI
jgi:signal peptidase I